MSKLTNLYYAHLKEREKDMSNFSNGSEALQKLKSFLLEKLNARDFNEAEELLNSAIEDAKEESFKDGCKYTFGLGLELSGQEKAE